MYHSSADTIRGSYQQLSSNSQGEREPIAIHNQLLLDWNTNDPGLNFVNKPNDCIINEIITLKQGERLVKKKNELLH